MGRQQTLESLADRVEEHAHAEPVLAAAFLADQPVFALADGSVTIGLSGALVRRVHEGSTLVVAQDGAALVSGGEDGRVVKIVGDEEPVVVAEQPGRWIDAVAIGPSGAVAWSVGKTAHVTSGTTVKSLALPTSSRGLAFAPKGLRLAASHADGVTLWFPNTEAEPERLTWKGSHLDVTWSPDARFVVSSMQDNQLHGWRLADKGHMRMSGYPGKTRSFSWSHDGLWLATSGAEAAIVWPFAKDGPMGKAPRECGVRPQRVSSVAFHPRALVLAVGYADGFCMLVRLTDAAEILVRKSAEGAISTLAWDTLGKRLAFGTDDGDAGVLVLPG